MPLRAPGASGGTPIHTSRGGIAWIREEQVDRTPIISYVKSNIPGWFGTGRRFRNPTGINNPRVSLGTRGVPVHRPSDVVYPVRQQEPPKPTETRPALPPEIDRRDPTPIQEVVPKMTQFTFLIAGRNYKGTLQFLRTLAIEQGDEVARKKIEAQMGAEGVVPQVVTTPPIVSTTKQNKGGSMDLGALITDLGTAYLQAKYQPQPVGYAAPSVQPAFSLEPDIPFVDIIPGKKKCRRRRRRLATTSDIKDLAALKAVLGGGEAFKTWIATHPA